MSGVWHSRPVCSSELTTTTLFEASRTWMVGWLYLGAIFTAVCILHKKEETIYDSSQQTDSANRG